MSAAALLERSAATGVLQVAAAPGWHPLPVGPFGGPAVGATVEALIDSGLLHAASAPAAEDLLSWFGLAATEMGASCAQAFAGDGAGELVSAWFMVCGRPFTPACGGPVTWDDLWSVALAPDPSDVGQPLGQEVAVAGLSGVRAQVFRALPGGDGGRLCEVVTYAVPRPDSANLILMYGISDCLVLGEQLGRVYDWVADSLYVR